jgi:hypothetical protein
MKLWGFFLRFTQNKHLKNEAVLLLLITFGLNYNRQTLNNQTKFQQAYD